jgi:hypothetical protein
MARVTPEYETITVRRANDKIVRDSTVFDQCDCCNKLANIEIEFTKRVPNKTEKGIGRPKKQIKKWYLCKEHAKEVRKILDYFQ